MNTDLEAIVDFDSVIHQIEALIDRGQRMTDSKQTIYTTEGYDESLTGTADEIIEYIEDETGLHVTRNADFITAAQGMNDWETDADDYFDTIYSIQLIETIILGGLK